MADDPAPVTVGQRIRGFRLEQGMTLTQLADNAKVSKSYLSELETAADERAPSGEVLYRIATALNVLMSDLLGKTLISDMPSDPPDPSLVEFARLDHLPEVDVQMLASIKWRGPQPRTVDRWRYIYQAIKLSDGLDR